MMHEDNAALINTAQSIGMDWIGSSYYQSAENWIQVFWQKNTLFWSLFDTLNLDHVVELACGHGRHGEITKALAKKVTLMDILDENVKICRHRFRAHAHVQCFQNNGLDLHPLQDGEASSVFCYDAMVHFAAPVVGCYLQDVKRVLAHGGLGLFHHSNYGMSGKPYGVNPHARNDMTQQLFCNMAEDSGLKVENSQVIPWGNVADLDCLTLVRKL